MSGPLTRRQVAAIALLLVALVALACAVSIGAQALRFWFAPQLTIRVTSTGGAGSHLASIAAPSLGSSQMNERLLAAGATSGADVEVCMVWGSLSDLDLSVRDPFGELIWARHARSASGGEMDVDANPTVALRNGELIEDPGPADVLPLTERVIRRGSYSDGVTQPVVRRDGAVRSVFTHTPVEHIHFQHAPKGTYTVYAHCYLWREKSRTPLPYSIQVRSRGQSVKELAGTLGPADHVSDRTEPVAVCTFQVA